MQPRKDPSTFEQGDDFLTQLARLGQTGTWESGTVVVAQGDVADCMYIAHSGELHAVVAGDGGDRWHSTRWARASPLAN